MREAQPPVDALVVRYPRDWPELIALDAAIHYANRDYAGTAQLARNTTALMRSTDLKNRAYGCVRLLLVAAEARQGRVTQSKQKLQDFEADVPSAATIAGTHKWI